MISAWYETASRYGQDAVLFTEDEPCGAEVRVFIKELDWSDAEKLRRSMPIGEADTGRYLYIGPPDADIGDVKQAFLECGGLRYGFRRAQLRTLGGEASHWEGIMRCLGEASDD